MPTNFDAKCAERDALLSWLGALEREGASLEAVRLVRAQLDRVQVDIARLMRQPPSVLGSTGRSSPPAAR